MSIGLSIDSDHSFKYFSFSICLSPTNGQLEHLYIGLRHQLLFWFKALSLRSHGSWIR